MSPKNPKEEKIYAWEATYKKKIENESPLSSQPQTAASEKVCLGTKTVSKHKAYKKPTLSEMFKGK